MRVPTPAMLVEPPVDDRWLDRAFAALADPTRRAILARLAQGDATVTELVAPFALRQPTISKHLKVLEEAGLIERRREAQFRRCHLQAERLQQAWSWLGNYREHWEQAFDRLDAYARTLAPAASPPAPAAPSKKPTKASKTKERPRERPAKRSR